MWFCAPEVATDAFRSANFNAQHTEHPLHRRHSIHCIGGMVGGKVWNVHSGAAAAPVSAMPEYRDGPDSKW